MAEATLEILIRARDEASKVLGDFQNKIGLTSKQTAIAGGVIMATGAGIVTALGFCVKAAAEEEVGITRLSSALANVGVSYDAVKSSLEGVISATMQKTAVSDDAQRAALTELIITTGNYDRALSLLPLALDLAAAKNIDLSTAAELVGRVAEGNTGVLSRYGIILREGATASEALAELQERIGGTAERLGQTTAKQFELLKLNIDNVKESIGGFVNSALTPLLEKINPIIASVKTWIEAHPQLTQAIVAGTAAFAALLIVFGALLMIIPILTMASGALGIALMPLIAIPLAIIAGIAALIAIGVLLWQNWDTIRTKAVEIWNAIVGFFKEIWANIVSTFKEHWDIILAILFPAVGLPILIARNWDAIKDAILSPIRAAAKGVETAVNWIIQQLNRISFTIPDWVPGWGGKTFGLNIPTVSLTGFATGGLITEPTLLYGLRSQRPYAIAGEHGAEVVSPVGAGSIVQHFNISQLVVREEADIERIARELYRLSRLRGSYV